MRTKTEQNTIFVIVILAAAWVAGSVTTIRRRAEDTVHSSIVQVVSGSNYGTGVVVSQTKVLTAKHVLTGTPAISNMVVITEAGVTNQVTDVLYLTKVDAAVLVFEEPLADVKAATFTTALPEAGDKLTSIGWGEGLYLRKESTVGGWFCHGHLIESHLGARGGDSGSPVFNTGNRVIGIILRKSLTQPVSTGILPTEAFKELL